MGNRSSTLRRSKKKEEEKGGAQKCISTTAEEEESSPFQKRASPLKEEEPVAERKEEEQAHPSSGKTKDGVDSSSGNKEESSAVAQQRAVELHPSPSIAETHNSDAARLQEEAKWVDDNMPDIVQNVNPVMPVADQMREFISGEMYADIEAEPTNQKKMRVLYSALTTPKLKSAFYGVLQEIQPRLFETEDTIKEAIKEHKANLKEMCKYEFEGNEKNRKDMKSLDKIYTELHIIQGESEHVNEEHEIWEIEAKTRNQNVEGTKINCNDIFKPPPDGSMTCEKVNSIRTVMTKGIAGIGKTFSVKKFILDWADGNANPDLDFVFFLPFRELNLYKGDNFSLETLVQQFSPALKNITVGKIFTSHKVLFIFDGLDETQLKLDLKRTGKLTDPAKIIQTFSDHMTMSAVDFLVTNLIRKDLLQSALIWITSRPGAVRRIGRQYIDQWTEVRGFNDPQKEEYFRKQVEDKEVAEKIIDHVAVSRSLYIMCHIPIFCWISAKVLEFLLRKGDKTLDGIKEIPATLTEMYTHFLLIQTELASEKYHDQDECEIQKIFMLSKDFILKLGRMAFEHLERSSVMFYEDDLKQYGIDADNAAVYCGLCTEMFKCVDVLHKKKVFCFVHLTVQEYFAGLFVYHSYAIKNIDSPPLKDFLLKGSEEYLKPILDQVPVALPLEDLLEISISNSTQRRTGELDMFLRFLIGMCLKSTQDLLQGLIQQEEDHWEVVKEIQNILISIDLGDCSPERCLNLVHCLFEVKDTSLHNTVQQYMERNNQPETPLSPVQCSALADSILMSNTPQDEFDLKKCRPSAQGVFRLVPAVRNCRKAIILGVGLTSWICETISSALQMPKSVLTELHILHSDFYDKHIEILVNGLKDANCRLEVLSLSGDGLSASACESLASALNSVVPNLRELELSNGLLEDSLQSVLPVALGSSKMTKLRLNRNAKIAVICRELVTAFTSKPCNLRELDLSYSLFKDSEMELLAAGLMSTRCVLEVLSLSNNELTEKGCQTLALALSSSPSHLRELDLSYNGLRDSGVTALCAALNSPHCVLETLRLSFCGVKQDGCAFLASSLTSGPCRLRELDLSFNHLTDEGVSLLTDARCSLKLNVEHNEECWYDLTRLRQHACNLTFDPNTTGVNIILSEGNKKATFTGDEQPYPDHAERLSYRQVLCKEGLTGRHYWEVQYDSVDVGVAYRNMKRQSDSSSECTLGGNENSWRLAYDGCFYHNGSCVRRLEGRPRTQYIGVYLDWPAGILSFFVVFPDTLIHLHTVHTTFTEALHPGFYLDFGSVSLCNIDQANPSQHLMQFL